MNVKMANVWKFCCEVVLILVVAKETLGGCTQDGLSYKCESEVDGKTTSVGVTLVNCKPPKIKIELTIEAIELSYEKEFDSSTDIPIPGASLGGLAGLYINVQLKDDSNDNIHIKINLRVKTLIFTATIPVMDERVAHNDCNEFLAWWYSQSQTIRIVIIVGAIALVIALISCCCRCYRRRQRTQFVMAPAMSPANIMVVNTSNNMQTTAPPPYTSSSKLPYSKLQEYN
ncbi:uncharacterized protein LOC130647038 [Hydractinia symbiolongicarpus]|uniref:uncharacterized protein LOC130647038 n=1 Tax=Hydractinia symbiolongicarpus TaxID=13093 RepID=UPI00254FB045|nr:uncharacterized protein LOC130647038 [Hydractinia symbiolongicarpus]